MTAVKRWVCRKISVDKFATSRSGQYNAAIRFDGRLQDAKIYRTRNGAIPYMADHNDYEWLPVYLSLRKPA